MPAVRISNFNSNQYQEVQVLLNLLIKLNLLNLEAGGETLHPASREVTQGQQKRSKTWDIFLANLTKVPARICVLH